MISKHQNIYIKNYNVDFISYYITLYYIIDRIEMTIILKCDMSKKYFEYNKFCKQIIRKLLLFFMFKYFMLTSISNFDINKTQFLQIFD